MFCSLFVWVKNRMTGKYLGCYNRLNSLATWNLGAFYESKFYDKVDDKLLKFVVIIAIANGKWIFCKHKERDTFELHGGHREEGETIDSAAKRATRRN